MSDARLRWRRYPLLHIVLFQAGWFACVMGAAAGWPLLGPLAVAALIGLHLALMRQPGDELRLAGLAAMIGAIGDSLLGKAGLVVCAPFDDAIAPPWMLALWMLFATTLHTYCRWLLDRPALAAACGAVAGPLSYYAAMTLGAVRFPAGDAPALAAIATEWALCMPLLLSLAAKLDGQRGRPAPPIEAGTVSVRDETHA